jgi:hypothetical protein
MNQPVLPIFWCHSLTPVMSHEINNLALISGAILRMNPKSNTWCDLQCYKWRSFGHFEEHKIIGS